MNNTLTLEDIAPYLPYCLKVKCMDTEEIMTMQGISYSEIGDKTFSVECVTIVDGEEMCRLLTFQDEGDGEYALPYLRPLSQPTKEILKEAGFECHIDYLTEEQVEHIKKYGFKKYIGYLPYSHIQFLLKNHYDINNLIGRNLALPILENNSIFIL